MSQESSLTIINQQAPFSPNGAHYRILISARSHGKVRTGTPFVYEVASCTIDYRYYVPAGS